MTILFSFPPKSFPAPTTDVPVPSPPVVQPICLPGSIQSFPDMINCRRFHLCYDNTLYHMWCAPGRNFDANTHTCLVGGQCMPGAFPIELEHEFIEIEEY